MSSSKLQFLRNIRLLFLRFEKQSLTFKLVLIVSLGFVVLVGMGTVLVERLSHKATAQVTVAQALYQSQLVKSQLTEFVFDPTSHAIDVEAFLKQVAAEHNLEQINLFGTNGEVLYSTNKDAIGTRVDLRPSAKGRQLAHEGYIEISEEENFEKLRMLYPIKIGENWSGGVELFRPLGEIYSQFFYNRFLIGGIGFFIIMIGAFLIRWFVHRLVKYPIKKMVQTINLAKSGQFDARVKVYEDPQLRKLSLEFNALLRAVEKANQDLKKRHQKELAQSNRLASMGQYISNISHEIKNPLAAICSALHVIQSEVGTGENKEIFQEMQLKVDHIEQTVTNLLRYARQAPPQFEPCSINKMIEAALQSVSHEMQLRGIHLERENPYTDFIAWADKGQMQQVLLNLFLNAIFAMKEGGILKIAAEAILGSEEEENKKDGNGAPGILIRISDTGPGIEAENLPKIFDPFFSTRKKGTGLGLSVAKGILQVHGGSIGVESRPGEGACFTLFLPSTRKERTIEKNQFMQENYA